MAEEDVIIIDGDTDDDDYWIEREREEREMDEMEREEREMEEESSDGNLISVFGLVKMKNYFE